MGIGFESEDLTRSDGRGISGREGRFWWMRQGETECDGARARVRQTGRGRVSWSCWRRLPRERIEGDGEGGGDGHE